MKDSKDDKETIIKMYKENKTVVEIAKTLGMGVGEVKLIIDLMNTASN